MAKIGRNDPCPCGSGKKYKKCHGGAGAMPPSITAALQSMSTDLYEFEEQNFGQISKDLQKLVQDLRSYDRLSCLTAVAALCLIAENRVHMERLDALLHLIAIHSNGKEQPSLKALDRWLNQFLSSTSLSRREDPAEDVAVGNIMARSGNRRVFLGSWSNPDYYLQDVLDAIDKGPETLEHLRSACDAALKISDLLAERQSYPRLTGKPESEASPVWLPASDEDLRSITRHALIEANELAMLQITIDLIKPFSMSLSDFCARASNVSIREVRCKPFIVVDDVLLVAFPTAISMAVISHTFSSLRTFALMPGLERCLHGIQGRTLLESTKDIPAIDFLTPMVPKEERPSPRYVSQTAFRFDRDKYLHLLFLHDDVYQIESDGPNSTWYPPFGDSLGRFIETSSMRFLTEGGCIGGLTLIVMGGVWRRFPIALPRKLSSKCEIQMWSSADVDRLMANERRWKLLLWKISTQRSALESLGISTEASSDANLYSMWTHHEYRLIPRDDGIDSPTDVAFFPEFIFDMRKEDRSGLDDHCVFHPDRAKWERVRKLHTRAYFKEDSARKTYGTLSRIGPGVLEGAVETAMRAWWVSCSAKLSDDYRNHLIYDLWETAVNWLDKIALTLDEKIPELGSENLIFTLDVSEIMKHEDWTLEGMENIPAASEIPYRVVGRTVFLRLPIAFVAMEYSPKNEADRLLVKAFVASTLDVAGVKDHAERSAEINLSLGLSDDDRFMHLFLARDARDYLHNLDREMPELLHDDEIAFGMIHIAQEAKLQAPSKIDTVEASNRALNQLVDAFWKRIEARLRELDRTDLVFFCVANHERLLRDQDTWRRTSRAVLSLHTDRDDVLKATQAFRAKQDRTQITHRILVEMAICTCPLKGGRLHTQADLDYLGSQVLLLIATAAQSDAVRAHCTDASMQISRLGDFTLSTNFMDIMHPYVASHFETSHIAEIQRYEGLFAPHKEEGKTEQEVFGVEFVESFLGEFGISPGNLAELAYLLSEDAITQRTSVAVREISSLTQVLAADGFSQAEIGGILRSFVLSPRDRWDGTKEPFRDKDWFPWRYRRRLSLMARPFVDLGDGRVVYAPGFCEDSFRHTVMECFQGAFDTEYFDSKRMKKYAGAVNARRGLDFNKAVGDVFKEKGWSVRLEVEMTELGAPADEASGDIDVFAWKGNVLCACECKELLFARTISEVVDQLARFRGSPGDDLDKHLRRAAYLHSHPERLYQITRIKHPRINPMLVTSKIVPMQFVKGLATKVVSADQITSGFLASLLS